MSAARGLAGTCVASLAFSKGTVASTLRYWFLATVREMLDMRIGSHTGVEPVDDFLAVLRQVRYLDVPAVAEVRHRASQFVGPADLVASMSLNLLGSHHVKCIRHVFGGPARHRQGLQRPRRSWPFPPMR